MYIFTEDGHIFDDSCACEACSYCENFVNCVNYHVNYVLPCSDCVLLLHSIGCAGLCKDCFIPKKDKDSYIDDIL